MPERRLIPRLLLALLAAAVASRLLPLLAPHDPLQVGAWPSLAPPGANHWLGADELGRDVLSRILFAAAATITISVLALATSLAVGVVAGALSGYFYRRWPDRLIMWVADVLSGTPFLVLIAGVLAVWGGGLVKAYAVLTLVMWTNSARQIRAEVIRILPLDWVAADRIAGLSEPNILFAKVLPKCLAPAFLFAVSFLPDVIALEAGLSFLGLGLQPPRPGLGKMIFDGIDYVGSAWWLSLAPAAMLLLIVAGVQALVSAGRGDQDGA